MVSSNTNKITFLKTFSIKLKCSMTSLPFNILGLLVFYEIFKYLEDALDRHKDSLIGDLLIPGMSRTHAFESDLDHYLGNWRDEYIIRPEVQAYLEHLRLDFSIINKNLNCVLESRLCTLYIVKLQRIIEFFLLM